MTEQKSLSFVANTEIERNLKQWAAADDRSVSYVLRKILEAEAKRRKAENRQLQKNH